MDEAPPAEGDSGLRRSPYLALGVAGMVVATAFATVAALAGGPAEEAQPERTSQDTVQVGRPRRTRARSALPLPGACRDRFVRFFASRSCW
jgi:hypothetical protein